MCKLYSVSGQINSPAGATIPFGTNSSYPYGIMPTNLPKTGVFGSSQDAADAYNTWKTNYVELCSASPIKYRVRFDTPAQTVSEGIGYGMILAAYAADKNLFDGFLQYYKDYSDANSLMNWKVNGCTGVIGSGAASDADLDAAIGLRIAMRQWPSISNYSTDFSTIINAIRTYEIQSSTSAGPYQTNNGDGWGMSNSCRNPSYQSPAYYKVFGAFDTSNLSIWNNAVIASYALISVNVNSSTGLVSNWCDVNGNANNCNGPNEYGWDACRFPWRMATDAIWWNDVNAQTRCTSLANFIKGKGVTNLKGPLPQVGGTGSYHSPAFVSTWSCSLLGSNSSFQTTLNAAYSETLKTQDALPSYFGNTLRLLSLFQMTGNFWNPVLGTTGIQENQSESNKTKCFPSPFSNSFSIESKEIINSVVVRDLTGKQILNQKGGTEKIIINASQFATGIYFINIDLANGIRQTVKMNKR